MAFSFYDILKENKQEKDIIVNEAPEDSGAGSSDDDFSIDADTNTDSQESSGDDNGDFDMGSLDDLDASGGDNSGSGEESSSSSSSSSSDSENNGDEEPVEANTDIFSSLTAEEQAIKIKELKKLYGNLYASIDELLDRINELEISEENKYVISKISADLYDIKKTLSDYILYIFPAKSFIENDINFNRFLSDINYISTILEKLYKIENKNSDK